MPGTYLNKSLSLFRCEYLLYRVRRSILNIVTFDVERNGYHIYAAAMYGERETGRHFMTDFVVQFSFRITSNPGEKMAVTA